MADAELSVRQLISSGGHWEESVGYSRAVVVGDACWVSGTTDAGPEGTSRNPGNPAAQARAALEIIERALRDAGFSLADVVRTRMFVTDLAHGQAVAAVHGEVFRDIRPASSLIVVAGFLEPSLLVEIEADAHRT